MRRWALHPSPHEAVLSVIQYDRHATQRARGWCRWYTHYLLKRSRSSQGRKTRQEERASICPPCFPCIIRHFSHLHEHYGDRHLVSSSAIISRQVIWHKRKRTWHQETVNWHGMGDFTGLFRRIGFWMPLKPNAFNNQDANNVYISVEPKRSIKRSFLQMPHDSARLVWINNSRNN